MLLLNADDVRRALPMPRAIEAAREAYELLARGAAVVPQRAVLELPEGRGTGLAMPAFAGGEEGGALVTKVVHLFPANRERGMPILHGVVLVFDPETGAPAALMDGATVTALRTGAAGGVAARVLARDDARVLAVFGAGVQARVQAEAVCCVREIEEVRFYAPGGAEAEAAARELAERGAPFPASVRAVATPSDALRDADVVVTATTAETPVFQDADLAAGAHVTAVGSYRPEVSEVPAETVLRARVLVDQREAALEEAGELIQLLHAGRMTEDHVAGELGDVLLGRVEGRRARDEVTLFKTVGLAVQDATAASAVLARARELGLGSTFEL